MEEKIIQDKVIQRYSGLLAQATYDNTVLSVKNEELSKELSEFHRVLNSDETLKALFDEQRGKL